MSTYTAENIRSLVWHEAIRLRPGMYLGSIDNKSFIGLLKNISSAISFSSKIDSVQITLKNQLEGAIIFEHPDLSIDDNCTTLNWKPNPFHSYVLPTLNALSTTFEFKFFGERQKLIFHQSYKEGILQEGKIENKKFDGEKIEIHFKLDETVWGGDFQWNNDYLFNEIRDHAYLHRNVKFEFNYEVDGEACRNIFKFRDGLLDRINLEKMNGYGDTYFDTHIEEKIADFQIEIAFAFRQYSVDQAFLLSYANDECTPENGTHVDGLLKGLTYGAMKYFQKHQLTDAYKISEKGMKENLIAIINIRLEAPIFSGCVKNKIANTEILEPIANFVSDLLFHKMENDEVATKKLIQKFKI